MREPYGLLVVLPWRPPLESFHPHCVMKYIHQSGKRIEHVPWSKCSLHHRSVRNDRTLLFHRSIVPIGFISSSSYLFIQSWLHIKNPTLILNLLRDWLDQFNNITIVWNAKSPISCGFNETKQNYIFRISAILQRPSLGGLNNKVSLHISQITPRHNTNRIQWRTVSGKRFYWGNMKKVIEAILDFDSYVCVINPGENRIYLYIEIFIFKMNWE